MATHNIQIVNPTSAAVTVNAKTAPANSITKLVLDDTVIADWPGWVAAGCALTSDDGATFTQRVAQGYLLYTGEAPAVDAGQ